MACKRQALRDAAAMWNPGDRVQNNTGVLTGTVVPATEYAGFHRVTDHIGTAMMCRIEGSSRAEIGGPFTVVRWDHHGVGCQGPTRLARI